NLLLDINRKSPTFTLREQVVNEIRTDQTGNTYWLSADRIDNATGELFDVAIYDATDPMTQRTTYADRGLMAFGNAERTDLYLTLYEGVVFETKRDEPGGFQQRYFDKAIVPLRGVGNTFESRSGNDRTDREMSIAMLSSRASDLETQIAETREEGRDQTVDVVERALSASEVAPNDGRGRRGDVALAVPEGRPVGIDPLTQEGLMGSRTRASTVRGLEQQISRYRVEIHKKYTLAFACIVFVLLGAPLAIRFPRGGLGLVIAASSGIFAVYWMGLIGGESLADRGVAPPAITMWIPNLVFTALGLWMFKRMGREAATTRGGGWEDLFYTIRSGLTRPFRRLRRT
ncbi:MAG TPA: LptF/LptG family permease, partial [Longimicrobiales bacterium]|nr:LptF/LptG family permease [Longimicrobiales bacterium]